MASRKTILAALLAVSMSGFAAVSLAADTVRIVTDPTFPPMEFSKEMGKQTEWTDIDFKGLIPAILSGRADVAVSAIYITDARKQVVDFTDSYYAGGLVVLTRRDGPIKTLKDLDGKRVSVQVGTKSVGYLQQHYPNVQRVEVEKNEEMFNLVGVGRADAAVTGKPAAKLYAQSHPDLVVLDEQITTEEYGIAVDKRQPELVQEFNGALKRLKEKGTYQQIVDKWFEGGQ
jgi:polar amino acid transport system substrate-binding protein